MYFKKFLPKIPYYIICLLSIGSIYEIIYFGKPHSLLHFRFGDDLVFYDTLIAYDNYLEEHGWGSLLLDIGWDYAYGAIYWISLIAFFNLSKMFGSTELLGLTPTLFSQLFLVLSFIKIVKIYKHYLKDPLLTLLAFLILVSMPMVLASGVRTHNYSLTLFLSSGFFLFLTRVTEFNFKESVKASLWLSLLLGVKISGAIIAPAVLGLVWSKKDIFIKNKKALFLAVTLTPTFFILFLKPSLLANIFQWDISELRKQINLYIFSIKYALLGDIRSLNHNNNVYAFAQHLMPMTVLIPLAMSGFVWILSAAKKTLPMALVVSSICSFAYITLTATRWHAPTYLIGHTFIFVLLLRGMSYRRKYHSHLIFAAICLVFSIQNIVNNFTILHHFPDYTKSFYRNAPKATQDFLNENIPKENGSIIYCDIYSICPWATADRKALIRLSYFRSDNDFSDADFIFLNKNLSSTEGIFAPDEDIAWVNQFIQRKKIKEINFDKIYESDDFIVFRRIKALNKR